MQRRWIILLAVVAAVVVLGPIVAGIVHHARHPGATPRTCSHYDQTIGAC